MVLSQSNILDSNAGNFQRVTIGEFGIGFCINVTCVTASRHVDLVIVVFLLHRILPPLPMHPSPITVTTSAIITTGIPTASPLRALHVDWGRQGLPADGQPCAVFLRPSGGKPRGHPEEVWGGVGYESEAASMTTAHTAVRQRRATMLLRDDIVGGSLMAWPESPAMPISCTAELARRTAVPFGGKRFQAAPWISPSVTMRMASVPPARWGMRRVATTVDPRARGPRSGRPLLMCVISERRGTPLAAGLRHPQPGIVMTMWPNLANNDGSGIGGPAAGDGHTNVGVPA